MILFVAPVWELDKDAAIARTGSKSHVRTGEFGADVIDSARSHNSVRPSRLDDEVAHGRMVTRLLVDEDDSSFACVVRIGRVRLGDRSGRCLRPRRLEGPD